MLQDNLSLDFETTCASAISPSKPTFQSAIDFIEAHPDWSDKTRGELKTALRQIAWSIALARARQSGRSLNPDRKALDLAAIPFDIPTINQALAGVSYGMAGFAADKSYRNAKSALRRVGRVMGTLAPMMAPKLPADGPYAPFLAQTNRWNESAARLFAARQVQQNRLPQDVTTAVLMEHGTFLRTTLIGVKVEATLGRIVKLWRQTAAYHPDWPQTPLTLPIKSQVISPPLSIYSLSLQQEIEAVRRWMAGSDQTGPFGKDMSRKPSVPRRSPTGSNTSA